MTDLGVNVKEQGVEETTSKLGKLKNALKGLKDSIHPLDKALTKLGDKTNLKATKKDVEETGKETKKTEKEVSKLGKALRWLGKLELKAWFAPITLAGKGIAGVTKKMGGLVRAFGRIAMYRAIRMIFSNAVQMMKEGVNTLYEFSSAMNGTFAKSMNSISTSLNYMKNSLGAMASPILNALAPAFDALADKIVGLMNLIQQFFASITGASTWTKATKQAQTYGDATDNATSSVKEFKRQLMGFDEINNLSATDSSGGGSSGGSSGGASFTVESIDSGVTDFAKKFKEAWKVGDFTEIGNEVGNFFNGVLDNINNSWPKIDAGFKKFATSIATFINGFSESFDPKKLAETVSNALKTIIETATTFTETVDWKQIGENIGGFIANIDWLGIIKDIILRIIAVIKASGNLLIGIVSAIANKFAETDWGEVKDRIIEGLKDIGKGFKDLVSSWWKNITESWDEFKKTWRENHGKDKDKEKLPIHLKILTKAKDLWKKFKENWLGIKNKDLEAKPKLSSTAYTVWQGFKKSWGSKKTVKIAISLFGGIKSAVSNLWSKIKEAWGSGKSLSVSTNKAGIPKRCASGGFLATGEAFIAREAGPEMVGRIGNRTAVANNDQIVAAISQGVYQAMRSAGGSNVNVVLQGDAKGVFKLVQSEAKSYKQRTGSPAFAR